MVPTQIELLETLRSDDDSKYVYRYIGVRGLAPTLQNRTMRFNTLAGMNDPRENRPWFARDMLIPPGDDIIGQAQASAALDPDVDRLLRGGVRIACFTQSRARDDGTMVRGWARSAMWAHYAADEKNDHVGACLVFDRDSLASRVREHFLTSSGRRAVYNAVTYTDGPIHIPYYGAPATIEELLADLDDLQSEDSVVQHLYFTKNTDWSHEQEWRAVLLQWNLPAAELDEAFYLPWEGALVGVLLGADFRGGLAESHLPVLRVGWTDGIAVVELL